MAPWDYTGRGQRVTESYSKDSLSEVSFEGWVGQVKGEANAHRQLLWEE